MITTRITLPKEFQAKAQYAATFLGRNIDEVYGALIIAGVGALTVEEIPSMVKPFVTKHYPVKAKAASSGKAKAS